MSPAHTLAKESTVPKNHSKESRISKLWKRLRQPYNKERLKRLDERWQELDLDIQTESQALGKYLVGCGATHGIHEACNFGCTACYLGKSANQQPPMPFSQVRQQIQEIRQWLGPGGNLQITSGEVTLLPVETLTKIIKTARDLELSPMVMTHGDILLHNEDYLKNLVEKAGLQKISIHVDSTQRGRRGFSRCDSESQLNQVRQSCAQLLRRIRKLTGTKLKAATTMTVNQNNLEQLPQVLDFFLENLDCFRILSLQPQAETGRTGEQHCLDGDLVWSKLCQYFQMDLNPHAFSFGHLACNRIDLLMLCETGAKPIIMEAFRKNNQQDQTFLTFLMKNFSGIVLNEQKAPEIIVTIAGVLIRKPKIIFQIAAYIAKRSFQEKRHLPSLCTALFKLKLRLRFFALVVHDFMDAKQLETELGQKRLKNCSFKLNLNGKMVSMCEMNGSPLREASYQERTS